MNDGLAILLRAATAEQHEAKKLDEFHFGLFQQKTFGFAEE